MSGIDKRIELVRTWAAGHTHYGHQAATDTLAIITAYEESQKELGRANEEITIQQMAHHTAEAELEEAQKAKFPVYIKYNDGRIVVIKEAEQKDYLKLQAELLTANKRIAELEKELAKWN